MIRRLRSEAGQAAPLYITAVTGLLFLALIFFTFGEADVKRNGAQSAADASALAAAKQSRSLMKLELKAMVMDRVFYTKVFNTPFGGSGIGGGCWKAYEFAEHNNATVDSCGPPMSGDWGARVAVRGKTPMTAKLVSGAKGKRAKSHATAVVESRCKFIPNPDWTSTSIGTVVCSSGVTWVVSPKALASMPDMPDLFSVRLVED
ncbi:pilus assembly protein TadG-related protein [Streptomyces sp. NPDC001515]